VFSLPEYRKERGETEKRRREEGIFAGTGLMALQLFQKTCIIEADRY
jgi:hypothetical protein